MPKSDKSRTSSIADETRPVLPGEFKLAMNHQENYPEPSAAERAAASFRGPAGRGILC